MLSPDLPSLLEQLVQQAVQTRQRRLLVLSGESDWAFSVLSLLPERLLQCPGLWVGDSSEPSSSFPTVGREFDCRYLKASHCHQVLGQEFGWLVFDARNRLDPDALGACSGTLCGGGLLMLLLPSFDQPAAGAFGQWFRRRLCPSTDAELPAVEASLLLAQNEVETGQLPDLPDCEPPTAAVPPDDRDCLTQDQSVAVQQVIRVVEGHRRRPLVISADRGRGKSAALGIAAARLMQSRSLTIQVTAPSMAAVAPLFERLQSLLPGCARDGNRVSFAESRLEFVALDQLLDETESHGDSQAGLLLVDEAAAIPAPMLERLLRQHSRIVFATTTHGYEGTGRGFQIRFRQTLDRYTPHWRQLELQTPIRWADGDPLERWVFDTLLLDAEPARVMEPGQLDHSTLIFSRWSAQQLIDDPEQLRQLFALLVQAHYRTKPGDLRDLLDDPAMQIWLLHAQPQTGVQQLVGVLWVAEEGGFEPALAEQIWLGQRRPRGHLLPQVLSAQAGWQQAAELRCWRIVRIAVPHALRRKGLGAELVKRLLAEANQNSQVDLVGTSFGATPDLLPFWFKQQLQPLRLGIKRDASSGCVSLLYASACSATGQVLIKAIADRFGNDLPYQLQGANADLEPELVRRLLYQTRHFRQQVIDPQDQLDLHSFVQGQRQLQQVEPALYRWSLQQLSDSDTGMSQTLQQLLIWRLVQRHDWSLLLPRLTLSGQRQAEALLKQELQDWLEQQRQA